MLDLIIRFLQRIQAKKLAGNSHHGFRKVLSIFLGGGISFLGIIFILELERTEGLMSIPIIAGIILLYLIMIWCTFRDKTKPFEFLYLIQVPFLVSVLGLIVQLSGEMGGSIDGRKILLFCIGIYPLLHLLDILARFSRVRILRWLKNIFLAYNTGYFLLLTINYLLLTFGFQTDWFFLFPDVFEELISSMTNNYSVSLWETVLTYPMAALIITFPVFSVLTLYRLPDAKKLLRWGCVFSLVILAFNFAPQLLSSFYEGQINKASSILNEEGENQAGFKKAQVWFFQNAALYLARNGYGYNVNDVFEKIYDASIVGFFGDRLEGSVQRWTNSFATDASHVGEAANVLLTLAEIHSETENDITRTTYTFDFQNTADMNQEVVVFFQTPSILSVVSGLKLGLDLQLIGQIAPRGAALKVYEESLRRNTDPALIEKVGMSTYSLRVFPIPAKTNSLTQGRQKVQVEILTPNMSDEQNIVYVPKFSFMNLRFDEGSRVIAKVYDQQKLTKEDIIDTDVQEYLSQEHLMPAGEKSSEFRDILTYCFPRLFYRSGTPQDIPETQYADKVSLFFDISKSAERNKVQALYADIHTLFKNYNNTLNDVDLYAFNFDVQRISDLQNLSFWGYSDTDRIMEYIDKNGFQNQRIVIVTDDDSFNLTSDQNQFPTLQKLYSNKIDIIKVGPKVKSYKTDITNLVAATGGNMYEIINKEDIVSLVGKIKSPQTMMISNTTECISSSGTNDDREKIQAGIFGNILLRQSSQNATSTDEIYSAQNTLAERYKIVNQYNSMIALETDKQQQDLDRYSTQNGAYETDYKNFSSPESTNGGNIRLNNAIPRGINPGVARMDSGIASIISDDYYRSRKLTSELNLTGIYLLLIYLVEILSFINFLVLVWRKPAVVVVPEEKVQ